MLKPKSIAWIPFKNGNPSSKQISTYLEPKDTKEMGPPYKLEPNEDSLQPWVTELSHTSAGNTN